MTHQGEEAISGGDEVPHIPGTGLDLGVLELSASQLSFWRERIKQIGASRFIDEHVIRHNAFSSASTGVDTDLQTLLRLRRNDTEYLAWLQTALDWITSVGKHVTPTAETIDALTGLRATRLFTLSPSGSPSASSTNPTSKDRHGIVAEAVVDTPNKPPASSMARKRPSDRYLDPQKYWFSPKYTDRQGHFSGGDTAKCVANEVPWIENPLSLAEAIGIAPGELAWLSLHRPTEPLDHYFHFSRPKRNGGTRMISSPKQRLRVAQDWILTHVITPVHEQRVHDAAYGFRLGRSVADNASVHVAQPIIVRMDFEDFFGNILFGRVTELFESLGYNKAVATILGVLVTEIPWTPVSYSANSEAVPLSSRRLPQGACTSPSITNILCVDLDTTVFLFAESLGFRYTRYADDLVFSHSSNNGDVKRLITGVRKIADAQGFAVNEKKTAIMRTGRRQMVTGLVVNRIGPPVNGTVAELGGRTKSADTPEPVINHRVRPSRTDLRRFRALMHQCRVDGFDTVSLRIGKNAQSYIDGYLSYVHMIDKNLFERLSQQAPLNIRG